MKVLMELIFGFGQLFFKLHLIAPAFTVKFLGTGRWYFYQASLRRTLVLLFASGQCEAFGTFGIAENINRQ